MGRTNIVGEQAIIAVTPLLEAIASNGMVIGNQGSVISKDLQLKGVDLMLWRDDRLICFEVKGTSKDKPEYEKAFIEVVQDTRTCSPGWAYLIDIDYLLWVYLRTQKAYMFKWVEFKTWFEANLHSYPTYHLQNKKWDTIGILIPWRDISQGLGKTNFGEFDLNEPWKWVIPLKHMGFPILHKYNKQTG